MSLLDQNPDDLQFPAAAQSGQKGLVGNTIPSISEAKPLDGFFVNAIARSAREATVGADMRFRLARDYGMDVMDQANAEFASLMEKVGLNAKQRMEQAAADYAMPVQTQSQGITGDETLEELIRAGQEVERAGQEYTNYTPQLNPNPYYPQIEQVLGSQQPYPQMGQPKAHPLAIALSALFGAIAPQRAAEFAAMPLHAGIQNALQDFKQKEAQYRIDQQNRDDLIKFLYERADEFTKREYERIANELDKRKAAYTIAKDRYDSLLQNQYRDDMSRNRLWTRYNSANTSFEKQRVGGQLVALGEMGQEELDSEVNALKEMEALGKAQKETSIEGARGREERADAKFAEWVAMRPFRLQKASDDAEKASIAIKTAKIKGAIEEINLASKKIGLEFLRPTLIAKLALLNQQLTNASLTEAEKKLNIAIKTRKPVDEIYRQANQMVRSLNTELRMTEKELSSLEADMNMFLAETSKMRDDETAPDGTKRTVKQARQNLQDHVNALRAKVNAIKERMRPKEEIIRKYEEVFNSLPKR